MNIEKSLSTLKKSELIQLVERMYGLHSLTDQIIEQACTGNSDSLKKQLKSRVSGIKRAKRFIDYHQSFAFSQELEQVLNGIKDLLINKKWADSFDVVDAFLLTTSVTFERVDDSAGVIGDVYREAVDLWVQAADQCKQNKLTNINWSEKVLDYFNNNDYGICDNLLPQCGNLLSTDELKQLAWRFEAQAKSALKNPLEQGYNFDAAKACIGLQSVAEALEDVELYERATLITSPNPNDMQKQSLAEYCLEIGLPERALTWLTGEWTGYQKREQNKLLIACYQQLNQPDQVLDIHRRQFQRSPEWSTLKPLLEIVDESEKQQLIQQACDLAQQLPRLELAIDLLYQLGQSGQAAKVLFTRADELPTVGYPTLLEWVKQWHKSEPLIAVLCYRTLLLDILESGRSKAYHHAADYFNRLLQLGRQIDNYHNFPDNQQFVSSVQAVHWRKTSFWQKAGYPAKGS